MSDILCITHRALCREDFLTRLDKMASAHPAGIILREKDLPEAEYAQLARKVLSICQAHQTPCLLHTHVHAALALECKRIHLPMPLLRILSADQKSRFSLIGASCHSVSEALEAQQLGCGYITAGHIFDTSCKQNLPGRGLDFLSEICQSVSIPVYAIGGITPERIPSVRHAGAAGGCVMSACMECEDITSLLNSFS